MSSNATSRRNKSRDLILSKFLAGEHRDPKFRSTLLSEHQDLLPELDEELAKLEKIQGAVRVAGQVRKDRGEETQPGQQAVDTVSHVKATDQDFNLGGEAFDSTTTVPNYQLLRCVGQGGFGQVWLAKHLVTRDFHAVKVLGKHCSLEIEGVRRYTEQLQSLTGLVEIKEVGKTSEGFYYVMPLADDVKGAAAVRAIDRYEPKTLAWCHQNLPPLNTTEVIALGVRLLTILENLHETGLTHCDVKPANIISIDGQWMLSDIGLMTRTDQFPMQRGTAHFLPPDGRCDHSADLYAVGKTLFLLSTGAGLDRFDEFCAGRLALPMASPAAEKIRDIICRGCHEDPSRRYQAARQMRLDLQRASSEANSSQKHGSSEPSKTDEQQQRTGRRRWMAAAALSGVSVLLLLGAIFASGLLTSESMALEKQVALLLGHQSKTPLIFRAYPTAITAEEMDGKVRFTTSLEETGIQRINCLSQSHRSSGLSVGGDKGICFIDSETGKHLGKLETANPVNAICWSRQRNQIIFGQGATAECWQVDLASGELQFRQMQTIDLPFPVTTLAWSDRLNVLAVGSEAGKLCLIPVAEGESHPRPPIKIHNTDGNLRAISWYPGRPLLALGFDNEIRLVWVNRDGSEELRVDHEIRLDTRAGRQLAWHRGELANVAHDSIERWTFTEDREYFTSPHLQSRRELTMPAHPR